MADCSLLPAMTRTPSSMRATTLAGEHPSRKAMPFLRQAAKKRSRAPFISRGDGSRRDRLVAERQAEVARAEFGVAEAWHGEDRFAVRHAFGALQLDAQQQFAVRV